MVTCRHKPSATRLFNSTFRQTIEKTLKPAILPFVMGPTGDTSPPNSRTPGRGLQTGLWEAYILTVETSTQFFRGVYCTRQNIYKGQVFYFGYMPATWPIFLRAITTGMGAIKERLVNCQSEVTLKDMSDVRIPWCQYGYPEGYEWCQDTLMSVWLPWRICVNMSNKSTTVKCGMK